MEEAPDRKFDDLLTSLKTGKWNLWIFFVVSMLYMWFPAFVFSGAFAVPNIPHTCIEEGPKGLTITEEHSTITFTTITTNTTTAINTSLPVGSNYTLFNDSTFDEQCSVSGDPSHACSKWAFNTSVYGRTMTSEFELVCERRFLKGLYSSIFYFGGIGGSSLSGWASDRFGRRRVLSVAILFYSLIAMLIPWMYDLTVILALRYILGFTKPFIMQSGDSLVIEVFEGRWRSTAGMMLFFPWCLGMMIFPGVCFIVLDWRWQNFYLTLPVLVFIPLVWMLPESPRWLIVRGHHEEAYKVLKKAAKLNKSTLPPFKDLQKLMQDIRDKSADGHLTKHRKKCNKFWSFVDSVTLLHKTKRMNRITLIIYYIFFVASMGYIGLSLSGDIFSSNPFIYMAMSGVMEIPGSVFTIPILEKFGRRNSNVFLFFLTGSCILGLSITPNSISWLVTTLAQLGKLILTASFQIIYFHGAELFPTEVRTWGMGNANTMGVFGSVFASFSVSALPASLNIIPSIVIGCGCILASVVTLLLPETKGAALNDTVAALEAAGHKRSEKLKEEREESEEGERSTSILS